MRNNFEFLHKAIENPNRRMAMRMECKNKPRAGLKMSFHSKDLNFCLLAKNRVGIRNEIPFHTPISFCLPFLPRCVGS